jgi:hypothetical protein
MRLLLSTLAVWAALSNLLVHAAVNRYIKRQVIQEEYDFIVCGGLYVTKHRRLLLTYSFRHMQAGLPGLS